MGQVLGSKGSLPSIYTEIEINYFLLRRLLGVKTDDKKQTKVSPDHLSQVCPSPALTSSILLSRSKS